MLFFEELSPLGPRVSESVVQNGLFLYQSLSCTFLPWLQFSMVDQQVWLLFVTDTNQVPPLAHIL